ncbi:MAG: XTP/dITP diphosphatase [Eubacterium sp.]|jgi:XTP/dITP diphosphohydrolase
MSRPDESKVVIASRNRHKIEELETILGGLGFSSVPRDEAGIPPFEVAEDGATFEENSFKKAEAIVKASGMPAIADDSGLMVDALDGAPGVMSARFAGEHGNTDANNKKLLALLDGVPDEKRTAKFVCVITLLFPDGKCITARGECPGKILTSPRGGNGFGYDPLFVPDGYDLTFAEMDEAEKNKISHRAKALSALKGKLADK